MKDYAVRSTGMPSKGRTYGIPIATLALASTLALFPDQIGNFLLDLPKIVNPEMKCELVIAKPKPGQNTRQFINEYKGQTKVPTSDLIALFGSDNLKVNASRKLEDRGLIYPTEQYILRRNCKWDYGSYSGLLGL